MARGSKKWLTDVAAELSKTHHIPGDTWYWYQILEDLGRSVQEQRNVLALVAPTYHEPILRAALKVAGFQEPEDPITKKFHDAVINYRAQTTRNLPALHKWATRYMKQPYFKQAPSEQHIPLEQLIKTRNGAIRSPVHELYRELRGNARLNESKDLISVKTNNLWSRSKDELLRKLVKQGHIKHDPYTGVTFIPRDVIRQIDPYYERYQETLRALQKAIDADFKDINDAITSNALKYRNVNGQDIVQRLVPDAEQKLTKYRDLAKAFMQDQMRRNMPRIADDVPIEERNRLFAEYQNNLENVSNEDISNGLEQMRNLSYLGPVVEDGYWPTQHFNSRMRLASLFSEKGLRSLLNNPKRVLKVAQINELLEDKWDDLTEPKHSSNAWWPRYGRQDPDNNEAGDRALVPLLHEIPNEDYRRAAFYDEPGGLWKQSNLQSLNNYDVLRRQLDEQTRIRERNRGQARDRIIQYIAAHPELQQLADQNALEQQRREQLRNMRGLPYTKTPEDEEEQRLTDTIDRLGGSYQKIVKKLLANPRIVELAEKPYQYSKDIQERMKAYTIPGLSTRQWRLAKNRRELYDRSLNHGICVGVPTHGYHDKALAKKSLIFFNGEHTDLESETGEIALYIDPKTHKIIKATVEQVHGRNNTNGKDESIQELQHIANGLEGKKATDINNVVEDEGIEYKEQGPQQASPYDEYMNYVYEYARNHGYEGDLDDYDDDNGYNYAQDMMRDAGYHMDDDGNYIVRGDPRYDDWDEWGNPAGYDYEADGVDFDEDDEGYAEGGFVEPIGNPAYRRLLELLLEDGMTKPTTALSAVTRRF